MKMKGVFQPREIRRLQGLVSSKLPQLQCGLSSYMSMYGSETKPWSHVRQQTLDEYASKSSIRLTPYQMLYAGKFKDGSHLIKSALYLQKELPIRIARRLVQFQQLPYIVLSNPVMHDVVRDKIYKLSSQGMAHDFLWAQGQLADTL